MAGKGMMKIATEDIGQIEMGSSIKWLLIPMDHIQEQ